MGPGWRKGECRDLNAQIGAISTLIDVEHVRKQIDADIACPATAELSPFVASRQCPRLQSQVSGEHVQADWSHQGEHHCVIVNIAPGIAVSLVGVEVRAGR